MFIDTHAHLLDDKFETDRYEVITKAFENRVEKIIEIGCDKKNWDKTLEFASKNKNVFFTLGIHPQEAKTADKNDFIKLAEMALNPKCAGIGETGLDYHYEYSPRPVQKEVFLTHLNTARKVKKPLIIHCREAYSDLIDILENDFKENGSLEGVIHCFSGSMEDSKKLINLGFLIGIDGPITYPNSSLLRETVKNIPLEKILLETDSPYLSPQKYRGKRNEPAYLTLIAENIAEIKQLPLSRVEEITTANASKLFGVLK